MVWTEQGHWAGGSCASQLWEEMNLWPLTCQCVHCIGNKKNSYFLRWWILNVSGVRLAVWKRLPRTPLIRNLLCCDSFLKIWVKYCLKFSAYVNNSLERVGKLPVSDQSEAIWISTAAWIYYEQTLFSVRQKPDYIIHTKVVSVFVRGGVIPECHYVCPSDTIS